MMDRSTLLHHCFSNWVSPQDSDRWYLFSREIIEHNQRLTIELSLIGYNDTQFSVRLDCQCVDSMLRMILTDITEIKKAELALREAEKKSLESAEYIRAEKVRQETIQANAHYTRSLLDASLDPLVTICMEGTITDVNTATERVTGLDRDYLIGTDFVNYFTDQEKARDVYQKVFANGFVTDYPLGIRHVSGKVTDVLYNASVYHDANDNVIGVFAAARDITQRKQIEQALRESEFFWKFAIEGSGDGVWDRNLLTDEMHYSPRWKAMLGYAENDILPTRQEWLKRIHPEDQLLVSAAMHAYLKGESTGYSTEYRLSCKDDSYKWIHARGMVVSYSEEGTPLRMIGTHADISKRKAQEEQDKAHLNQLAHVTRLGLMGEMASGIAHEINQPLTAISTYAQVSLNLMKTESPDFEKLAEVIYKTQQQALRAGEIIRRMRDFVKANTKQVSTVDLNELIQNAASLCQSELRLNNILLTFQLQNPLPFICVDKIQIEQVIINLIRNSSDALTSCPQNQQHEISIHSLLTLNEGIEIRIKDNGPGIPEDQQQKILMPFYTTKPEGMGMGLSISCSIIEAHNGSLHFNSQMGKGCTFYFTLPIAPTKQST
jgi:PAS domain S-box-containing protein